MGMLSSEEEVITQIFLIGGGTSGSVTRPGHSNKGTRRSHLIAPIVYSVCSVFGSFYQEN
jgi:hypothetical protein